MLEIGFHLYNYGELPLRFEWYLMRKNDMSLLFLLGAAHSLNHSFFLVLPPLLSVVVKDFNSTFEQIGFIATLSFLLYGLGAMVGGPLSDRLGSIKLIQLSSLIAGASTLIFLFSESLLIFGVGMLLMALGASFYHPTANHFISRVYRKKMAQIMGIHGAAGSLGQMFTPAIAFGLGILFGWRSAFVFFGLLSMIVAFLFRNVKVPEAPKREKRESFLKLFKDRSMLLIFSYSIISSLSTNGVTFFFPTFLYLERAVPRDIAAYANSALLVMGVAGQLIGGRLSDKYGSKKIVVVTSAGVLIGLLTLLLTPMATVGVLLFIVIYGISIFGNQPATTSLVGKVSPEVYAGVAFGVVFAFAFGLGSVSTTIAGYFADHYSLTVSYYVMAAIALVALVASFLLPSKSDQVHS